MNLKVGGAKYHNMSKKDRERKIKYEEYEGLQHLTTEDRELLMSAFDQRDHAYAPYSDFRVGACLLLENGKKVAGSNQENASFPAGLCAERVALFTAMGSHPGTGVKSIAVAAKNSNDNLKGPVFPCGFCAQVLVDLEERQKSPIRVILGVDRGPVIILTSSKSILPFAFSSRDL